MRAAVLSLLAVLMLSVSGAASAVTMDYVSVGNPGNACDPQGSDCFGSVNYAYQIGKYEVTNSQYVEFLNAKAASDPLGLYNTLMATGQGGITRAGVSGSFTYAAIAGREERPVNFVSVYDAIRFTNWMQNGQGIGDTETGSYTLTGGTPVPGNGPSATRNLGPSIFLASQDEWYKAAYYDALTTSYFDYPAGSDVQTTCAAPNGGANQANCNNAAAVNLTAKGSYPGSPSPSGAFDMGGNVREWTDQIVGLNRIVLGGAYSLPATSLAADNLVLLPGSGSNVATGFRIVFIEVIPEPSTGLLVFGGLLGMAGWRRNRR